MAKFFNAVVVGILWLTGAMRSSPLDVADQLDREGVDFFSGPEEETEQFRRLLKPFLRERVSGTLGNALVQEHILREMRDLGWNIDEDRFVAATPFGDKEFTNIVATLDPTAPSRLTLACHYDSKKFDDFVFIGATDSAVPCALLIDVARHLNASLWESSDGGAETTLQLIFFDGEEAFVEWTDDDSLYGSRHLAEEMEKRWKITTKDNQVIPAIKAISAFVLLDLIGTSDCKFTNWFPKTSHLYRKLQLIESTLRESGQLSAVSGRSDVNQCFADKRIPTAERSGISDDHVPFLRRNVSVLHLITYPFPKVWHKSSDNEDALSFPDINNLNRILRVFVADFLELQ